MNHNKSVIWYRALHNMIPEGRLVVDGPSGALVHITQDKDGNRKTRVLSDIQDIMDVTGYVEAELDQLLLETFHKTD